MMSIDPDFENIDNDSKHYNTGEISSAKLYHGHVCGKKDAAIGFVFTTAR